MSYKYKTNKAIYSLMIFPVIYLYHKNIMKEQVLN